MKRAHRNVQYDTQPRGGGKEGGHVFSILGHAQTYDQWVRTWSAPGKPGGPGGGRGGPVWREQT